jgi:general secretion pathway protein I
MDDGTGHARNDVTRTRRRVQRKIRRLARAVLQSDGFTLLEVIVAIAILAVGFSAVFGVMSDSLRRTADSERMAEAGSLTQSLLAQIGSEIAIRTGVIDGEYASGYRWRVEMKPFGDTTEREVWPVGAYAISAEVVWDDAGRKRSYSLTTLRLGPKEVR